MDTASEKGSALAPESTAHSAEAATQPEPVKLEVSGADDDWNSDPANPRNWTTRKKWTNIFCMSMYTFIPPLASSMMAPGLPEVARKYGVTDRTLVALSLSIFFISFAIAPLILAPVSEMYGRRWVYHISNLVSLAFNLGCAFSPNIESLIVFRFLTGAPGSVPLALSGGTVSDLFVERERAAAMAISSLGPLLGPAIGPIAGGFIAQTIGMRYVFVVIAGMCGINALVCIPVFQETYAPVIRRRLLKRRGDLEKVEAQDSSPLAHMSKSAYVWENIRRPFEILTRSLVCFMLSLYMALMFGIYYLMFSTFAALFRDTYGFSLGTGGLVYLGLAVGFLLATLFGARTANKIYLHLSQKNGGKGTPEMRLPALVFGALFVPVGVLWYGWSAQAKIHWIMPIIGTGIYGFGMMTTFLPIQLYLVDSFTYAGSAIAASSVLRCLLGFAFPLFANQMFDTMGVGGGNTFLAGLSVVIGIPFPIWLYYRGEQVRANSKYTR